MAKKICISVIQIPYLKYFPEKNYNAEEGKFRPEITAMPDTAFYPNSQRLGLSKDVLPYQQELNITPQTAKIVKYQISRM